jgi:predicted phage tail protein
MSVYATSAETGTNSDTETKANYITVTAQSMPPAVTTSAATSLTTTSATLNGSLTALGTATSDNVSFEWGLTTSYGNTTTPEAKTAIGTFSANLTGLTAGTTYHFRAKAVGNGTAYGSDKTFTTSSAGLAVPTLVSPSNGAVITDHTPYLDWSKVTASSTVHYQLQVSKYASFSSTVVNKTWVSYSYYTVTTSLSHTTYYWRVRAVDASGNKSAWSTAWSFRVA